MSEKPFIIAIDGPAASGKGTLARLLAKHYHLPLLDTGLSYRAVAAALLEKNLPLNDENIAEDIAKNLDFSTFDAVKLSAHEIGEAASKIAIISKVRQVLVASQRAFAHQMPGAVLDGRDIGTVVCQDADVKLYIIADVEVRAKRRFDEIIAKGGQADFSKILNDLQMRDARDMGRKDSPLKPAENAYLLNSTKLSIEAAFKVACDVINPVFFAHRAQQT